MVYYSNSANEFFLGHFFQLASDLSSFYVLYFDGSLKRDKLRVQINFIQRLGAIQ